MARLRTTVVHNRALMERLPVLVVAAGAATLPDDLRGLSDPATSFRAFHQPVVPWPRPSELVRLEIVPGVSVLAPHVRRSGY